MEPFVYPPRSQVIGAAVINFVMGLWLIGAPYALGYQNADDAATDALVVGLVIVAIAIVRMIKPATTVSLSYVSLGLGIWLVLAPFVLGDPTAARVWNNVIVGAIIISEAAVSVTYGRGAGRSATLRRG